jgi:hypothetical protein
VLEGELLFELEGDPKRVVRAGETFWEPGGDVIHYQDGNNLADAQTRFVVTMFGVPGQPMLIPVSAEELEERRSRRAPRSYPAVRTGVDCVESRLRADDLAHPCR